jgi:hypothetical protein
VLTPSLQAGLTPTYPQAGLAPSSPQAGSAPSSSQAKSAPSSPQAGSASSSSQAGSASSSSQAGSAPSSPQAGSASSSSQAGSAPSSPLAGSAPSSPYYIGSSPLSTSPSPIPYTGGQTPRLSPPIAGSPPSSESSHEVTYDVSVDVDYSGYTQLSPEEIESKWHMSMASDTCNQWKVIAGLVRTNGIDQQNLLNWISRMEDGYESGRTSYFYHGTRGNHPTAYTTGTSPGLDRTFCEQGLLGKRNYMTRCMDYVLRFGHYPIPDEGFIIIIIIRAADRPGHSLTLPEYETLTRGSKYWVNSPGGVEIIFGGPFNFNKQHMQGIAYNEFPEYLEDLHAHGHVAGMFYPCISF